MRIAFLVPDAFDGGGTASAVATQANALCSRHEIEVLSLATPDDHGSGPSFWFDPRVVVRDLATEVVDDPAERDRLRTHPVVGIDPAADPLLTALADVVLEAGLPALQADVLVTVTPALLSFAAALAPRTTALVHQEHRSSSQRRSSGDLLLAAARRADLVAMLTQPMADWITGQLGPGGPRVEVVPNALPPGFRPVSPLTEPVVVAAGRLAGEKQWTDLVAAFALVADRMPSWRLRIFGDGPARFEIQGQARKLGLWDRVELPGPTPDLASEWARASISALTSRSEGYPLVLQEAMAAGLAVISYDAPSGPRAIIDDGVDGLLVATGSVPAMARALLRLGTDSDLRTRLGSAARAGAGRWDSGRISERWDQLFTEVVEARRGGRHLSGRVAAGSRPLPTSAPRPSLTPTDARAATLALATTAAARTGARWWVVPPHAGSAPVVALPMSARRPFLTALAAECPDWLSLVDPERRGWPERRGRATDLLPSLLRGRTGLVLLEPWPPSVDGEPTAIGRDCGVEVSFWEEGPDGDLHATSPSTYAARVPTDAELVTTTVLGIEVPTLPVMVGPTPSDVTFDVDAVLTWVDGSDPAWQSARTARLAASDDPIMRSRASSGAARYTDRGELRGALRGLHLFAPWVRRIHLVTAGQVPSWLDVDHPQIHLVDHRDIMPAEALPTFNSHAIEAAVHHIDGLAEHFVYLNDDVVLGRPTWPERFFTPAGDAAVAFSPLTIGLPGQDDRPYLHAAATNRRLLEDAFGVTTTHLLAHAPFAHRVSVLREVEARFGAAVATTVRAPFRSATDVSLLSSLGQHYALLTGRAVTTDLDFAYVDITEATVRRRLRSLLDHERAGVCLGESHDFARDEAVVNELVSDFLGAYVPLAAPWER